MAKPSTSSSPSPIDNFSTKLTAAESIEAAVGADVIVIADTAAGNVEHAGEAGLGLLRHLDPGRKPRADPVRGRVAARSDRESA